MYGIVARIWNEVARSETLKTPIAKRLFVLDQEKLNAAVEMEEQNLKAMGANWKVATALMTVGPLLWENAALMNFVRKNPAYLGKFPVVVDRDEAVLLATHEFEITNSQQNQLRRLLLAYPKIRKGRKRPETGKGKEPRDLMEVFHAAHSRGFAQFKGELAHRHIVALAELFAGWAIAAGRTPSQSAMLLGWSDSLHELALELGPEWEPEQPELLLSPFGVIARGALDQR